MHITNISVSTSPARTVEAWKTVVQPHVASTHYPTYNIIGAALKPRIVEDDITVKPVVRRNKHSSSSSSPRKTSKRTAPVTRENLFKISMACAREEDLDAPYRVSEHSDRKRSSSDTSMSSSSSSSDLPSIVEEEE